MNKIFKGGLVLLGLMILLNGCGEDEKKKEVSASKQKTLDYMNKLIETGKKHGDKPFLGLDKHRRTQSNNTNNVKEESEAKKKLNAQINRLIKTSQEGQNKKEIEGKL